MPQFPTASFILSAWQPHQFPADEGSEVAFAGRSNAGKSSALNAITGRKDLARTSKTPGRTQLINFFGLDGTRRLVDLPGYGFAKVPEHIKQHWQELLTRYIEARTSLAGLVIVMDSRRPLTDFDVQMLDWSGANGLAAHVLLTKADKLGRGEAATVLKQVRARVEGVATVQLFSAVAKTGVDDARRAVLAMLATSKGARPFEKKKKKPGGSKDPPGLVLPGMGMDRASVHSGRSANGSVLADARRLRRLRAAKVPEVFTLPDVKKAS